MTARHELAKLLFVTDNDASPDPEHEWEMTTRHNPMYAEYAFAIADAILAADFRKPRTITTANERAILRPGTICMDRAGNAWKRGTGSWVSTGGDTAPLYDDDDLELTILHEGTQP